jgi:hypothetical protein
VYRKAFEAVFFVSFLLLYYAVLLERNPTRVGNFEAILYVWIAAFAYDELSGLVDSGMLFYQMTFWNLWDLCIIGTGLAFVVTSKSTTSFETAPSAKRHRSHPVSSRIQMPRIVISFTLSCLLHGFFAEDLPRDHRLR